MKLRIPIALSLLATFLNLGAAAESKKATGVKPRIDASFFNGKDLTGWKGNGGYWSVKDGAIVGIRRSTYRRTSSSGPTLQ